MPRSSKILKHESLEIEMCGADVDLVIEGSAGYDKSYASALFDLRDEDDRAFIKELIKELRAQLDRTHQQKFEPGQEVTMRDTGAVRHVVGYAGEQVITNFEGYTVYDESELVA